MRQRRITRCAPAATRFTLTSLHHGKAQKSGFNRFMSLKAEKSTRELWVEGSYYTITKALFKSGGH
jgi:hypothetical protein